MEEDFIELFVVGSVVVVGFLHWRLCFFVLLISIMFGQCDDY